MSKIECNFVVTEEIVNGLCRKIDTNYGVRAGHGKLRISFSRSRKSLNLIVGRCEKLKFFLVD